jgi:hypothetical protein
MTTMPEYFISNNHIIEAVLPFSTKWLICDDQQAMSEVLRIQL